MSIANTFAAVFVLQIYSYTFSFYFDNGEQNLTEYSFASSIYNQSLITSEECSSITNICIRKCCKVDYVPKHTTCVFNKSIEFEVSAIENENQTHLINDSYNILYLPGVIQCASEKMYLLDPLTYYDDVFVIQRNGSLWLPEVPELLRLEEFCLDYFEDVGVSALICYPTSIIAKRIGQQINATGMIISMPFLLVTLLVYAVLPDRNLHGKSLICYVFSLLFAYVLLVFMQLYPVELEDVWCKTLGLICLFLFMASFFWMNVMSIDIWWAFSGLRGFTGSRRQVERKRFIVYCAYAWGVPFLHIMLMLALTLSTSLQKNTWYNPGIGEGQCWFRDGYPTLLYFYGPMSFLILVNIVLFSVTAYKIKQVKQDTAMLRKDESKKHCYENDKQRFNLYLKLMMAMGVNWSMEIVSWTVNWQIGHVPPAVWYLTDFCNALYGVFIFFIFVFKRNIWKLLKKRYYMIIGKPHLARSMTQNPNSPRTTGSTLSHTVATEKSFVNDSSILTSEVA